MVLENGGAILNDGVFPVAAMLLYLIGFKRYFNGTNRFWKFGSSAAYTVYLIHPPFVACVTRSYYAIAGAVLNTYGDRFPRFQGSNPWNIRRACWPPHEAREIRKLRCADHS